VPARLSRALAGDCGALDGARVRDDGAWCGTVESVGRPKKEYPVVARLPKWSTKEWNAWRGGVEHGQIIGRDKGHEEAVARQPRTDRALRVDEVLRRLGVSRSTLYRWSRRGHFPRPVQLGPGVIGYSERDVVRWLAERTPKGV